MPVLYIVGAVLSVALFVYLFYAMLEPEKFS
jgi:K+-transporting ATPase KdpF subunit